MKLRARLRMALYTAKWHARLLNERFMIWQGYIHASRLLPIRSDTPPRFKTPLLAAANRVIGKQEEEHGAADIVLAAILWRTAIDSRDPGNIARAAVTLTRAVDRLRAEDDAFAKIVAGAWERVRKAGNLTERFE